MSVVLNLVRLSKGLVPRRAGYDTVRTCKFVGPTEWPWFDPDAIKNPATKKIENWASMQHDFPTESNDMWEVSTAEWPIVERLIAPRYKRKPDLPPGTVTPGGYVAPSARPGDHPYFVGRTSNFLPRVHMRYHDIEETVETIVSGVDGDIFLLAGELEEYLLGLHGRTQPVVYYVEEPKAKIFFQRDFVNDIKRFLLDKGF